MYTFDIPMVNIVVTIAKLLEIQMSTRGGGQREIENLKGGKKLKCVQNMQRTTIFILKLPSLVLF